MQFTDWISYYIIQVTLQLNKSIFKMHRCNQAISGWKEYHMSENTISLYVYKGGQGEITEKKSRFIATVRPVESEDEAVSFINETKKKYWDARHNCSAFVIGKR